MKLLRGNHIINGNTEYFRQRRFNLYRSAELEANNAIMDWTSIRYLIGECWKGHRLEELNTIDKNHPYAPSFWAKFEFIEFEGQWEKNDTIVSSFEDIHDIIAGMFKRDSIFMSWKDWPRFLVNEASGKQRALYKTGHFWNDIEDCNKKVILDAIKEYEMRKTEEGMADIDKQIEDLRKCAWYAQREIQRLESIKAKESKDETRID